MSTVYRPMSISKKIGLAPLAVAFVIRLYFKPRHCKVIICDAKCGFLLALFRTSTLNFILQKKLRIKLFDYE